MATRRDFIGGSIAAGVLAGIGYVPGAFARSRTTGVGLYKAIYDERYTEGVQFADEIKTLGIATRAIRGDITDLWFDDLALRWKQSPVAIAGLTTESALFCLERLAWDHRLRVVFRADHALAPGCVEHTVSCSSATLDQLHDLERINTGWWAPEVAHVVAEVPARKLPDSIRTVRTPATGHGDAGFLVSWVIAPVQLAMKGATA